ncbi:alpha/beta hydrolase [Frankia sp. AgB1.9]|uniref:alpha/beta fold hydrolase n=1 Tax=unclassified Frankia TaxID=2632575 RepID=UPI001931F011|nr:MULTISPECIES: alpha/beta hydrolase [unclassified Frankia]MBL7487260.1 alpha/beta hydrolase [Frankia sp. AgW1.1]MBL7547380.1 alpha/beta hydrolase [Frankia sp. AgB1.9]MBL7618688.1 alpha/beta hydrolase [Frankia sp. AgB1.8]
MIKLTDGTQLWTTASGAGPPIVLCHGGPGLWDYLAPLAGLLDDVFTVIRFDQRGCGRSTDGGGGRFTIAQALDDLDQVRAAYGVDRWGVVGHSWGAELGLRYAARSPDRVTGVAYVAGVGAGNGFRDRYIAERQRRLGADLPRWTELADRRRSPAEEREWCLLQWRPDFSPGPAAAGHAAALWATRPPDAEVNFAANRQLWAERKTEDLLTVAAGLFVPVTMLLGADDPRPWQATDSLLAALPHGDRIVFDGAGHAPWVEQPSAVRDAILVALAR